MLTRSARSRGFRRRVGDAVLGSWTRTVSVVAAALVVFGIVAGLAATGRLGDLRYANIPLMHPWPPAGYVQNPFDLADRGALVSLADAARVRSDLVADGEIELRAMQAGDAAVLTQSDVGNSLAKLQSVIAQNKAAGITESFQNRLTSARVGKLVDPNDPSVTWCVEEVGTSQITLTATNGGSIVRQYAISFDDKFWMVKRGGRYLITDAQVTSQPVVR